MASKTAPTAPLPHPESLLRLTQIIGNKKTGTPPLIPVSRATWYDWIKSGKVPKPSKIGEKINGWKAKDIYDLINTLK